MDIENLYTHFLNVEENFPKVSFFLTTSVRRLIWLLANRDYDGKKNLIKNFNYYYKNIPDKISSQININNQIDLAIEEELLIKKKSIIDKRSIIVTATPELHEETIKFFSQIKKIL